MREVLLAQLTGLFGHDIKRAAANSVAVNWDAEPWVRGYVATAQPGAADARQRLAEPLGERLFLPARPPRGVTWATSTARG
jgi:monoamine oxidase